jgi:teichoic acid transport system permease protein
LGPYLNNLWERRHFIAELARSELKAADFNTTLGQFWTVLHPIFTAAVYFVLIGIVAGGVRSTPERLTLLIGSMFLFFFTRYAVQGGAKSVVAGRQLLLNSSFPRALLPITSVLQGFLQLLPSLLVYAVIHVLAGRPVGPGVVVFPVLLTLQTTINLGVALLVAVVTVYFRDASNILTYALRLWMYATPVLYPVSDLTPQLKALMVWNPLYPLFAGYQEIMLGRMPTSAQVLASLGWAVAALLVGSLLFLRHERAFAARL